MIITNNTMLSLVIKAGTMKHKIRFNKENCSWQTSAKTHTIGVLCLHLAAQPLCSDPTVSLDTQTVSFRLYLVNAVANIPELEQATLSEKELQTRWLKGKLQSKADNQKQELYSYQEYSEHVALDRPNSSFLGLLVGAGWSCKCTTPS